MKNFSLLLLAAFLLASLNLSAQQPRKDKGTFIESKPGYYKNYILKGIEDIEKKDEAPKTDKGFKIDLSNYDLPTSIDQFTKQWANEPISQGNTGTCWCFSATSYFESEIYRLTKQQIKLSEIFTVYWEYVEKARRFVRERGKSAFAEGSEGNAVSRIWKQYGIVPLSAYSGLKPGQIYHNHEDMFKEMDAYLKSVKEDNAWNEELILTTIRSILNNYLGEPPAKVNVNGKEMTPQEYLKNVVKLNLSDYLDVMSLMGKPYWEQCEYEVGDNWWHCADYYNVPLDEYMEIIKKAIRAGYTFAIGGDVSEAGMVSQSQVAVIPSFDIPSEYIDESARQFRFTNGTTTDDHGLHVIGYYEKDGVTWFLLKDSGSGSRNVGKESKNFGYYFFHADYLKLKMMDIMIHKDMLKDILPKFVKK
jgi:bleomycin hydrolase